MDKKRAIFLRNIISVITILLTLRIFQIIIFHGSRFTKAASLQRINVTQVYNPRGNIIDRNGIPFTNRTSNPIAVIKPSMMRKEKSSLERVCNILDLNYDEMEACISTTDEPLFFEIDESQKKQILDLETEGVTVINTLKRYNSDTLAKHVLGYINKADGNGETGIEKKYDNVLKLNMPSFVGVITDGLSRPLQGLGYRIMTSKEQKQELNVKLTIDYHIQKIVETVMEKHKIKGAVVVEDVYTGDILAMASKPDYNQNDVASYLNSNDNELFNRAVASYNAGSVFKIIVAAQALESNTFVDKTVYCPGYTKVGNIEFKCSSFSSGGHGNVDFVRGFASSCNTYYINMGIKLGSKGILSMAEKFGLGKPTGIYEQGIDEAAGNLPSGLYNLSYGETANISIGQGDIMVTPLQIADIVATVANGGIKNKINIVDSIVDNEGNKVRNCKIQEGKRIISKSTAETLKSLMTEVTYNGTGQSARLSEYGGAAGKTGSAEGPYIDGYKVVHAWFAGYFPLAEPKYSIAVFVEDGRYGGQTAAPIFEEIAEEIMKAGY